MDLFIQGLLLGVAVAAPLGPCGTYCATRILSGSRRDGLACAAGISLADGFYSSLAGMGLKLAMAFVVSHERLFLVLAGLVLLFLGCKIMCASMKTAKSETNGGFWATFGHVMVLSSTNPAALAAFASLFAGLGLTIPDQTQSLVFLVAGVMAGSALWWIFLTELLLIMRNAFFSRNIEWINRIGGAVIACFGLVALGRIFFLQ